jgi:hypothetical protein
MMTGVALCAADATPATPASPASKVPGPGKGTPNSSLAAAPGKLNFPGVTINVQERSVDIAATVCLRHGSLELVACTKGTKEHESIVAVEARPMHIHAALLLLGAKPGSPATRRPLEDQAGRWAEVPPGGGPVDVFLVLKGEAGRMTEHPISDFIVRSSNRPDDAAAADPEAGFPTHTFLFAGSVLHGDGPGPRRYLSDETGNVISLATFGDELLCLPEIHSHDNRALMWEVNPKVLPAVGSSVTLRLRPQIPPASKTGKAGPSTANPVEESPGK